MIHDFERRVPANLILPVLALCAGITVAGVIFYRHQAAETRRSAEASLMSIANLKASQIAGWIRERKGYASVAAKSQRILQFSEMPNDPAAREATSKYCDSLRQAYDYEAVAILDAQGSPLLVSPSDGLKAHSCATALVLAAAQTNDVVMADLHRGPSEEKVHLSFLHSIVDASGTNAAAVGVVLLVVDPYRYLYPLLQSWPVPSQTAESLLIRHEGNEVVYLNELRHRKGAPLSLRIADSRTDVAGVRAAVLGERGIIRGKDYRGIPITSVGCGVPETPWILGAKIDMAEVDASLNQGAWMIGSIIFLLDVAVILGVFGLWRENWLNFLRRASEKKYKVLFESSRDAIMTLAPPTWCFTSANPATIAMFGVRDEAEFRSFNQAELSPGFQPDGQKSSEKAHAMIAKAMNDGANFFEWTHQRVNGQTFPATVLLTRVEISGQQFLQATIRDITEQKNAEKAQTDSRDKYQALVETTGDFVWEMDTRGIYTYCSPQMKTLWGYEPDEMVGKSPLDVMPPETRAQATELLKTLVEKHEPFSRMEIPSFDSKGNLITIETSGVPFFDTHGRLLGYRGITRDITERKRAEDAPLAAKEAKFTSLLEGSSDGVVICDFETHAIHRGNAAICRMLGYSIDELLKLRLEDVHPAEELPRILDLIAKNIRGEEIGIPDLPMKRKDGSVFYASLSPLTINIGGVRYVAGFFHDATHRRNAERALREGEEFIRIILDSVDSSICVLDEHGNITAVNQPWRRFSEANAPFPGAPVDNCGVGWNYLDVCEKAALESDTIAQRVYDGIKDVIAGCRTLFHIEYPCDYGSQKNWFSMKVTRLGLGQKGVVVAHTDVTERKNAEESIRQSENRFRKIFENNGSIMLLIEPASGAIVDANEAAGKFYGYSREQFLKMSICQINTLDPEDVANERMAAIHQERNHFIFPHRLASGEIRDVEVYSNPVDIDGQAILLSIIYDITERKHAERQLAADFAAMMRLNKLGSLFLREGNLEALLTEVVDTAIEISGADFGNVQLLDPSTGDLHIVTQKGFPKWWLDFWNSVSGKGVCGAALERGERVIVDDVEHSPIFIGTPALEIQLKAGVRAVQSTPLISRSGKLVGMFSTHFKTVRRPDENAMRLLDLLARQAADLIEHAQSELAQGESEMKFRTLFERMAQGVVYQGRDGAIISANAAAERILGLTLDQLKRRTSVDPEWHSIHEDGSSFSGEDHPAMIALSTGRVVSDVVMGVFNPRDHLMRWISITAVPEFLPGEEMPHRVFTTFDDITERRRAAEKLRLSEAQFKGIFQGSADGIVLADPATKKFKLCNEGMSRMSGYSLEDLGSMSVDDLHPTKELPFVIAEFEKLLRGEIKVSHEIPIQRKDGSILHADITTALIPIDGVVCLAGFFRDVTERRTARLNLEHRLNYEHVLSRVTQMTNEEDDIEALQQKCVDMLGQALDVSRVYICAHCEEDNTTSNTFEWVAPGITGQKHNVQNVPSALSPWCFNEMLAGRPISVEDIELLPDEKLKTLLRARNSISLLAVPIFVSGRYFGFMGFDECRHRRAWPEEDAELLRTLVRSIGDALERHIAAEKLRLSEERFRTIFEGSPEGILLVDPSSKKFKYSNETMCRMLGYSMAEIVTLGLDDVVPLDQLPRTIAEFERQLRGESKLTRDITFTRKDGSLLHVDVTSSAITIEGATYLAGFMSDISARMQSERFSTIQLELATALSSCHDLITGLRHCMDAAIDVAGCDSGGIYLVDERTGALDMLVVHQGLSDEFTRSVIHFDRAAPQTLMVMSGKSFFAPHAEIGIPLQPEQQREGLRFLAIIPMHYKGRIIGCINIASHTLGDLSPTLRQDLQIVADAAASAVSRLQAEMALQESNRRLQMALTSTRMGVWEFSFITQKLQWSPEIFENLGIPFMEPSRERMLELVHPDDINLTQEAMDKAIREHAQYHCEYRVIIGGKTIWLEDRGHIVRAANDQPIKVIGTAQDITTRKLADATLQENERQLSKALDMAHAGYWEYDIASDEFTFNDHFYRIFHTTAEAEGGYRMSSVKYANRFCHPDDVHVVGGEIEAILGAGTPSCSKYLEHRFKYADGGTGWLSVQMTVIKDENGRPIRSFGINQDITESKNQAAEIVRARDFYLNLLEHAPALVWRAGTDAKCDWFNEGWLNFTGRKMEQELGDGWADGVHPEDLDRCVKHYLESFTQRLPFSMEYRLRRHDGQFRWIVDQGVPFTNLDGSFGGYIGYCYDITQRRNAEDDLRSAIVRSDHLNSLLRSIHDVQSLLAGAGEKQELLEAVCDSLVKTRGYISVWFGEPQNEPKRVKKLAHAGPSNGGAQHVPVMWDDSPLGGGPAGLAIRGKRPVVISDLATDPRFEPWRSSVVGSGAASIASVPLIRDGEVCGVLTVQAGRTAGFTFEEIELLQTLVVNLGGALERLEKVDALRDSHSLLTATLESTADGILVVDNTGKVVRFNQRFLTLWHIPRLLADAGNDAQLLQFVLDQLIEPQAFVAKVQELYQNPHASSWDEITFHDGRVFERYSQPQQIGDTVVGRVWSFRDVSERKRDQATLEEREKRLNAILKTAQDAFWFLDIDGRIKDVNDAACQLYGYTREEMLQLAVADFDATETKKEIITRIENITRLHSDRFEVRHRCKDGRVIDVEISANFIDLNGAHLVIFIRDITRRKKTEADVQRLAMVVEQAAEMVMITDVKGALQYVNPSFEKVTGHSKSDVLGKNPNLLSSGKHDGTFFKQMWESILRGDVWHGRVVNKRKDGTLIEQDVVVSPVRDTGGTITNFVAAMRDVTREQQLEQQVQQSQKMEAIGRLAGGVAHDFNNILTATLMCLDMLKDDPRVDDSLSGELQELTKQANRAAALTRQLLMFSRRSIMQTATLDFNEVLTNVLKMLRRILGEDINIGLQLKNDLPLIEADGGMMEQIIMNLSVNARDAMPKGGRLTFATSVANFSEANLGGHADRRAGRFVTFSISDTGTGMDEKTMEKIFEPFFTTKGIGKGTGLGLATVYGICQQHRGWIEVTSEIGKGSTFRVYLPAKTATPDGKQAAGERKPLAGGSETLLLVEDEADVRKLTAAFLRRLGYVVLEASTGAEALDIWETASEKIALLYTDMVMPGEISGRDLARILCEARPGLPVMISSGYSAELTTEGAIAADEIVFVPKPCPPKDIAALVRKCLDAQR